MKIKNFINIKCFRRLFNTSKMANSRYEYVKSYETNDEILKNVYIVARVDGKAFHKFCTKHNFEKPNDLNALNLMSHAAINVMKEFRDIILAYGQSDEYSFVFRKETEIYNRRSSKLLSYVTSIFSSAYVYNWGKWFPNQKLLYPPCFDGRIVLYPSDKNLRDYLSWRQADVHINNLYNTAFWNLVLKSGLTNVEAEARLRGTFSDDKNELLFSQFGINYNNENPVFRKGTILLRKYVQINENIKRQLIIPYSEDMIRDHFWKKHDELLGKYVPGEYEISGDKEIEQTSSLLKVQIEEILESIQAKTKIESMNVKVND
ncbi:probable tRNA(His) guanylyltransferase [Condylostylus longicornis]|uniref:probable tRNA(His) guanylyltransferase n=1 Tax=Condylostylus longicornis TaxID=2530218 RepID=UPI00244E36A2|nr:probable tRNA(His) guanylyltransferase [Condylostylus longicornis]